MRRNVVIWGVVMVIGIAVIFLYPVLIPVGAETGTRFGAGVIVPAGYLLALIGGAGMLVSWLRTRHR